MKANLQNDFTQPLLNWYDLHGRKDLPWQHPRCAYRVWVSEIMLQQTQVQTVIAYFNNFMAKFPSLHDLANASLDEVMAYWSGLGYYSRARNLHKTAKLIVETYQGIFPQDPGILVQFPGIGLSTAAAITSQAFNLPTAILDGNVKRVLARYFMVDGQLQKKEVNNRLWELAKACMPNERCADYTQAIMDLGATCCMTKKPECFSCPLQKSCQAYQHGKVLEYPFKKEKKSLPHKKQQFLLLYKKAALSANCLEESLNHISIYLEKNPPNGLWGGLWCMPALDLDEDPFDYIYQNHGLRSQTIRDLMQIKHSFSHFHLHIHARMLETQPDNTFLIKESPGKWIKLMECEKLGLAKPTKDIINQFVMGIKTSMILYV